MTADPSALPQADSERPVPQSFSCSAALRDGTPVCIRAVRPDDKTLFKDAFGHLSPETIYRRFFQAKSQLTEQDLHYLTDLDFKNHVALAVTIRAGSQEELIGVGRYVRLPPPESAGQAEVAFTVVDQYQGQGVATLLLAHLVPFARAAGIDHFEAQVQPANHQMLEVFEHSGLPIRLVTDHGLTRVLLALDSPPNP